MKKILFLFAIANAFLVVSCGGNIQQVGSVDSTRVIDQPQGDTIMIDSAKTLIDQANKWVEKGIRHDLSVNKVNNQLRPIMTHYRDLVKRMKPADTLLVHQYRIDGVNKLINLQIELDTKKK